MTQSTTFPGAVLKECGRDESGQGWAIFQCDLENGRRMPLICERMGWYPAYNPGICRSISARTANIGVGEVTFKVVTTEEIDGKEVTQETEFVTEFSKVNRLRWVYGSRSLALRCIMHFSRQQFDAVENFDAATRRFPGARGSLLVNFKPFVDRSRIAWKYRVPLERQCAAVGL